MDANELRCVQGFVNDYLDNYAALNPICVEYASNRQGGIVAIMKFKIGDIILLIRNNVYNSLNLDFLSNNSKIVDLHVYWDDNPSPDANLKDVGFLFHINLEKDLKDHIILPIKSKDNSFANNVYNITINNDGSAAVTLSNLDSLNGFKLKLLAFKMSSEEEE